MNKTKKIIICSLIVFGGGLCVYLPKLGSYGLFDPWETHYSEVSRSMIQQDDYISTFWQDKGFFSKPVLTFWLQATGMRIAGLNQDNSSPGEMALSSKPEWATRIPVVLLAIFAIMAVFIFAASYYSISAGFFSAAVLALTPHFALIARQTITDMPFFALMTIAMVFFIAAMQGEDKKPPHLFNLKVKSLRIRINLAHLAAFWLLLLALSQYFLFSSNLSASFTFFNKRITFSGYLVFLPYLILIGDILLGYITGKTSYRKIMTNIGFSFIALGILAKGFGALFIPGTIFFIYFLLEGEWEKIERFDLLRGIFIIVAISFPWHHAMIIRHGGAFYQEYFVHHHFKRAAVGVHGERGVFTYYLKQLAFGLLPFLPIIPGIILDFFGKNSQAKVKNRKSQFHLLLIWLLVSFFLFSFMLTKFHHYILPFAAPFSILAGIYLAKLSKHKLGFPLKSFFFSLLAGFILLVFTVRELFLDPAHIVNLFVYKYERLFPYELNLSWGIAFFSIPLFLAIIIFFFKQNKKTVIAYLFTAFGFTGFLIYYYIPAVAPHWSQKKLHEIYYKCRKNPSERFIAWQLNWRGENFYSKNKVLPFMSLKSEKFNAYLKRYRTRNLNETLSARYLILENRRFKKLRNYLKTHLYNKHKNIYDRFDEKELVTIIQPDCKTLEPQWEKHYRQSNYLISKVPYPNNKFILVRILI
ncbi:MAG: ArnT family glycosyltransferase [Myxococcota bacterium]